MRRRIVLIGHSPVSLFIAQKLDHDLGPHVENQLIWLSGSPAMVNFPLMTTVVGRRPSIELKPLVDHSHVGTQPITRINLTQQYLVLPKQIVKYDYLILDASCQYRPEELDQFAKAVEKLFALVKARRHLSHPARARVVIEGDTVISYQLALLIGSDARQFGLNADELSIEVERPADDKLRVFLSGQGLVFGTSSRLEQMTTVRFQAPQPSFKSNTIRGLPLDRYAEGKVRSDRRLRDHDDVWYLGARERRFINLWRPDQQFGQQIAKEFLHQLPEPNLTAPKHIKQPTVATFLTGSTENYLDFEGLGRGLATRQLVRWGEYRLWQCLKRCSS